MLKPVKEMLDVTWRHLNISCSDASIGLFLKVQRTETINPKRNTCGLLFFISCFDALHSVVRFALLLLRLRLWRKRKTVSRKYDKKEVERRIMHVMCCYQLDGHDDGDAGVMCVCNCSAVAQTHRHTPFNLINVWILCDVFVICVQINEAEWYKRHHHHTRICTLHSLLHIKWKATSPSQAKTKRRWTRNNTAKPRKPNTLVYSSFSWFYLEKKNLQIWTTITHTHTPMHTVTTWDSSIAHLNLSKSIRIIVVCTWYTQAANSLNRFILGIQMVCVYACTRGHMSKCLQIDWWDAKCAMIHSLLARKPLHSIAGNSCASNLFCIHFLVEFHIKERCT